MAGEGFRRTGVWAALALVSLTACAWGACSPFGGADDTVEDRPDATAPGPPADAGDPTPADGAWPPGADGGLGLRACGESGVFCDDFEGDAALPRAWTNLVLEGEATMTLSAGAGRDQTAGLDITAPGATQASYQQALLLYKTGPRTSSYTVRMAFAASVNVNNGSLSGPRVLIDIPGRRDIGLDFTKAGLKIQYNAQGCNDCAPAPADVVPIAAGWHHYILEARAEVIDASQRQYGTLRLWMDDELRIEAPLGMNIIAVSEIAYDFGLTYASPSAKGKLFLDDAYFEIR